MNKLFTAKQINAFIKDVLNYADMHDCCYNCANCMTENIYYENDDMYTQAFVEMELDSSVHYKCIAMPQTISLSSVDKVQHYCGFHKRISQSADMMPYIALAMYNHLGVHPIFNGPTTELIVADDVCRVCDGGGGSDKNCDTLWIKCRNCNGTGKYDYSKDSLIPMWRRD